MAKTDFIEKELKEIKQNDLFRTLKSIEEGLDSKVTIKGKNLINFCSNDYLGLSDHPKVVERAIEIMKKHGVGAGASRLVSGNYGIHEELESDISKFKGTESSIVFPSGYMANMGTIQALVGKQDAVIIDRLDHASIVDGARLSGAKLLVYSHKDMADLEKVLSKAKTFRRRLVVTDHVFSMDGDIAPVNELIDVCEKNETLLMIDTAHSTGVLPMEIKNKAAISELIIMGTLSKAVGSLGGFVSGSQQLIEYLRNKARTFVYTTALPPSIAAASIAAIEIIGKDDSFRKTLWQNVTYLQTKLKTLSLNTLGSQTQIVPILMGDAGKAVKISDHLFDKGILLTAIRPPTVPKDTSRLRLTVTAKHTKEDIDLLATRLSEVKQKFLG